jgi:hypothetical protein
VRGIATKDYPPDVIEAWAPLPVAEVALSVSPSAVLELMSIRHVFVALVGNGGIGTASLDGSVVRTLNSITTRIQITYAELP